jgi:hypothetical protein
MGIALAVGLLLVLTGTVRGGAYNVAQCGWRIGADASWADTTGGVKFGPDAYCLPPGPDPFDGAHLKTYTRGFGTVSGTRFGRWRWQAPPGTGIVLVRASWWHGLHDGFQQRLGTDPGNGGFVLFGASGVTELTPREFVFGFATPQAAFEDRLLCAREDTNWCSTDETSWSGLRGLTLTIEDDWPPAPSVGGQLLGPGWHRGVEPFVFWTGELGGGDRFQETLIDGARVNLTEYPCAIMMVEGEWRSFVMEPCPLGPSGGASVDTTRFSDGVHLVHSCSTDFAGNVGCSADVAIAIDNTPPAHPGQVTIAGGEGWHRTNDFDLSWTDPDQGPGSPIAGVYRRITGTNGYDSGVIDAGAKDIAALPNLTVPGPGAWNLHLWLRDWAANASAATGVDVPLRFDDAPPSVAFAPGAEDSVPDAIRAAAADPLAGPAGGTIAYRKPEGADWIELPTKLVAEGANKGTLVAPTPELGAAGLYLFRVEAVDGAGNTATSTLRADGTRMALRRAAGPAGPGAVGGGRAKVRLFARLRSGRKRGGSGRDGSLTVPFGTAALVAGRLTSARGAGIAGRRLRVVARPSRGALAAATRETVTTGKRGGFELRLAAGPSRRVAVYFAGGDGLAAARRTDLDLRVRSGVSLSAAPTELETGQEVHLRGRVRSRGAPIPRRGKLVAIQYLEAATHRWRPVLVVRSDHGGRFHTRYRFRYVNGAARIQLRATALAEERWPYAPGSSSPVTVDVRGR